MAQELLDFRDHLIAGVFQVLGLQVSALGQLFLQVLYVSGQVFGLGDHRLQFVPEFGDLHLQGRWLQIQIQDLGGFPNQSQGGGGVFLGGQVVGDRRP